MAVRFSGASRLWGFALALALAGCAVNARKDTEEVEAQLKYAASENAVCRAWLRESDVYRRANETFVLDEDQVNTERKMALDRNASDNEKVDLLRLNNLAAVCRKKNLENFGRVHPEFVALIATWYAEDDALLAELLGDRVTIGEANRIVQTRLSARQTEAQTVGAGITRQLETPGQAEIADRQRAVSALRLWNDEQKEILQYRQRFSPEDTTRLTSCSYTEDDISCTMY